jgi:hypothetical protein
MADRREEVLTALEDVLKDLTGFTVKRNDMNIDESELPIIIMLDGDEDNEADAYDRGRPSASPQIMRMYPQVYFALQDKPEVVGPSVNATRGTIIHAVISDVELQNLCFNREIRYEGMESDLNLGSSVVGQAGLQFSMAYVLNPDDLAPVTE